MKRYDLVGRKVNGYAQSTVEEHPMGAYVKHFDFHESVHGYKAKEEKADIIIAGLKKSSQHQLEVIERLLIKSNDLEAEAKKQNLKGELRGLRKLSEHVESGYALSADKMIEDIENQLKG
jgi:mRNA-degrading endonuclease YafQ of YafQ-DinJ toxin-antitoxin module